MKKLKIFLMILVLFISISTVYADGNFTSLQTEIDDSTDSFEINQDYKFDKTSDTNLTTGININKTNFVINGNGHTIDGNNQSRIFNIIDGNITIKNLNLINGYGDFGGAIFSSTLLTLENMTFETNVATTRGGALTTLAGCEVNDCNFVGNHAPEGSAIYGQKTSVSIDKCYFTNDALFKNAFVYGYLATLEITNSLFANTTAEYSTAIYNDRKTYVINTTFINLHAIQSAGAVALKELDIAIFENCKFINTTSEKNAGAIFIDTQGFLYNDTGKTYINNSFFSDCSSDFGGALVILSGIAQIKQCTFSNNTATYDGGAMYLSSGNVEIINTLIENNKLTDDDANFTNGGGVYSHYNQLNVVNSHFKNNTAHGIYSYDSDLYVDQCLFLDNGYAIYAVFADKYNITDTNIINNDTVSLENTNYIDSIYEKGAVLEIVNNTIILDKLPKKYDLRDFYLVSSVKDQNRMSACWAFGTAGALESALLKATGVEYDFSENNIQNSMLKYSKFGISKTSEGGSETSGLVYAINWFGMVSEEDDSFDEIGKISQFISTSDNIHVQDAIMVPARKNLTDNNALKEALVNYGALGVSIKSMLEEPYYNKNTSSQYYNLKNDTSGNHFVTLVGWDDTYSKSNFLITPPGDGAWIIKNSYGIEHGDEGFDYISYYDTGFSNEYAVGFSFENTVPYTRNYETDLGGDLNFYMGNGTSCIYYNKYQSEGYDMISAVGTYFKNTGEEYTLKIFVNDVLELTQNGTAPFCGFHTIKLDEYVPVELGDNFTVMMYKNTVPLIESSRQTFQVNQSFANFGKGFYDLASEKSTASLKVYTTEVSIFTEDLVKTYKNESKFEAYIGKANENVTFEINGGNYTRTSNEKGIAQMAINLIPKNYTIKTTYNGSTVENNVEVLPTLLATNLVKYFRNDSQFYIKLVDGEGKPVSGENITMNINGVFYDRATNENGTARLNINLAPGEYILTALDPLTGLQMSYTITVLPVLTAEDLEMTYKDGSKFEATLVDGQGKALANVEITFNINGVFYQRTTDSSGVARLNINLMAGEYIITSQYEQAVISNKITITA